MAERILFEQCPLCDGAEIVAHKSGDCSGHPLYNKALSPVINWVRCVACDHVFTDGYYSDESTALIFGQTNEGQKVGGPLEKNRLISAKMVEKILPYVDSGLWLDVGFGNGSLLFTAQEYGFHAVGIDLREENVSALKSLGIEAHHETLTNLALPQKCAVISMADVLEHIAYPKQALKAAHALLQDGGVLLLSMPNSENVIWQVMDKQNVNPYWGELEHYHNFSRTRLYALLEEFGFKAVRYGISERYRICMEVVAVKI